MAMLAGVLWFVVFLVVGTAILLAVTVVGAVLVPRVKAPQRYIPPASELRRQQRRIGGGSS